MKILVITSEYPPYTLGGVGRYSKEVVDRLREYSVVDVINVPTYALSKDQVVEVKNTTSPNGNTLHIDLGDFAALEAPLAVTNCASKRLSTVHWWLRCDYDVLFVQDYFTAQLAADIFLAGYASRMVTYCHLPLYAGFSYFDRPGAIDRQQVLESKLFRLSSAVIAPSSFAAGVIHQSHSVAEERLHVLAPGVVVPESQPPCGEESETFSLILVARLTHQKGLAYLPDLVSRLSERLIPFRVTVIGRGPLADRLHESLRKEVAQGTVEFVSEVDGETGVFDYYNSASVLVSLSLYETFGFAILEGMSRGCVPVGFDVEPIRDLVGSDLAKSFVDVGDVSALVDRIEYFGSDADRLQIESERAILQALKYSWVDHIRALFELFDDVT